MAAILFVRIKSGLDAEEFDRRLAERRPCFVTCPGSYRRSMVATTQQATSAASTSSRTKTR